MCYLYFMLMMELSCFHLMSSRSHVILLLGFFNFQFQGVGQRWAGHNSFECIPLVSSHRDMDPLLGPDKYKSYSHHNTSSFLPRIVS